MCDHRLSSLFVWFLLMREWKEQRYAGRLFFFSKMYMCCVFFSVWTCPFLLLFLVFVFWFMESDDKEENDKRVEKKLLCGLKRLKVCLSLIFCIFCALCVIIEIDYYNKRRQWFERKNWFSFNGVSCNELHIFTLMLIIEENFREKRRKSKSVKVSFKKKDGKTKNYQTSCEQKSCITLRIWPDNVHDTIY